VKLSANKRSQLLRIIGTVLALALLAYLLSQQGWNEIKTAFHQIPLSSLLLALLLTVISRLAIGFRWYSLMRSGGLSISLGQSMRLTFAGLFANNFLPATIGGDIVRLAGAIQLKLDGAISTASLIVDRLVGMAGMAMTAPIGLYIVLNTGIPAHTTVSQAVLLAGLSAHAPKPSGSRWYQTTWQKAVELLRRLLAALRRWLKQPGALLVALAYSWINMLGQFGVLYVLFRGMDQAVSFWSVAGLYSLVYFVTLLPISINGYGLQELSMTLIFSHYAGVSMASGITAALVFRTLMILVSLPGAFFVPAILAGQKKTPVSNSQPGE
jgi:glycosyltransferase 2 family protein